MSTSSKPGSSAASPQRFGSAEAGAHAPTPGRFRTGLASVCISGTLEDKITAAAAAGFDGVEIFEPDFVASASSTTDFRNRCADLGLTIDLYQPFRDFDSVQPEVIAANLRRADRKFDVMEQLGTDLLLVCSSVSPDAVDDNDRIAEQLHQLASAASERGLRIAYEALAWGKFVNTYERCWDIVRRADHPALGLCLDSFHILSRGSDPAGIEDIPAEKLFFLQLADAPHMDMNVLQWSRHYRLFPGQGVFDLSAFLRHVVTAGYSGPLSLEVFNDVFRQAEPRRAAVDALRSLLLLQESTFGHLPAGVSRSQVVAGSPSDAHAATPASSPPASDSVVAPPLSQMSGYAFVELAVDGESGPAVAHTLAALGFTHTGLHLTKPVQLWEQGDARILVNATPDPGHAGHAAVAAIGVETSEPVNAAARAQALLAPLLPRTRGASEADLAAVAAPDGTSVFFCKTGGSHGDPGWRADFAPLTFPGTVHAESGCAITHVDHVALTQPFDRFDEAALFYRAVLGLATQHSSEIAAPFGLVRNRAVADPLGLVRICLSVSVLRRSQDWHPNVTDPQHVAFATEDVVAAAAAAEAAGARILRIPDNYYDDLDARLAPPAAQLQALRELGVMLDRDSGGEFLHFYTEVLGGRIFFEVVQRLGAYSGYGETNGPIRMAAHRRQHSASTT